MRTAERAIVRIALANLPFPATPDDAVARSVRAIADAGAQRAAIVCFPEAYVPGYRAPGRSVPPADGAFLERAWSAVAAAAAEACVAVVLGTERVVDGRVRLTALVVNADGTRAGFQDKVQLDPSEEATWAPGSERRVFDASPLRFGIAICHEGWRYPETVRWAARRGAQQDRGVLRLRPQNLRRTRAHLRRRCRTHPVFAGAARSVPSIRSFQA